jgi:CheY-like chemotaxis protein
MHRNKLILEVSDDAAFRKLVVLICERSGFQVLQAESGDDALRLYRKQGPVALVLTDFYYYDYVAEPPLHVKAIRTGIQLAEAIREIEPAQQVVIHSSHMGKEVSGIAVLQKGSETFLQELRSSLAGLEA